MPKAALTRKRAPQSSDTDRLPPHSIEAEQGVLGCVISDPSCLIEAESRIRGPSFFYDTRHQIIWPALVAMGKNGGIDVITLNSHLKKRKLIEDAGGLSYISQLPDIIPSVANLPSYLEIVEEKFVLRRTIQRCSELIARAHDFDGDIEEFKYATASDLAELLGASQQPNLSRVFKPSELGSFDTHTDTDSLLGRRWLCRGGKCLIVGPSGRGKSSLNAQMSILWALGRPFCGITPPRPLRQVIIGDENDKGDLAEMFQGVCNGLNIDPIENKEEFALLEKNLSFFYCPAIVGDRFISEIRRYLESNPVDLAWLDPLVSYADVDITKQEGAAKFLRQGLSRLASELGICWMVIHHTTKTSKDPKSQKGWHTSDYQYAGAGSYDISGWARAVVTLREVHDNHFCLYLPKRGERSGATHPDGSPAGRTLWLKHASRGIFWEQVDPPEEANEGGENTRSGKGERKPTLFELVNTLPELPSFLRACLKEGESQNAISLRLMTFCNNEGVVIGSKRTADKIIQKLASKPYFRLSVDGSMTYRLGKNP